ncbi:flagellar hook-length control protein FliK [Oribacterium sp. P6A1]|uniref:flagellar hook-length control protein FliK n=1 Tax=Oribacterium sp. P6A1 TaxID=1410612 RepID=UPI00055F691F|nr:flagellar hook-length control protein FliK [Oribacterium sp. P6A1]
MEAVNNYFTGSVKTVSWGAGTSGSGYGSETAATGGIQFSSLMKDSKPVKGKDNSGKGTVQFSDSSGDGRMKSLVDNKTERAETQVTNKLSSDGPGGQDTGKAVEEAGQTDVNYNAEEMAAMLALINSLQADRITTVSDGTETLTEEISTIDASDKDAHISVSIGQETVTKDAGIIDALQGDRITTASEGTEPETEETGIFEALQADRMTTASNGVELVTERTSTMAAPPSVDVSGLNSAASTVAASELVSASGSESSEGKVRSEAASKTTALETERNGGEETATKSSNEVTSSKYDPVEVLKSLEGQGHMVVNSSNSPSGTPSTDTNGPTGRDPGEKRNPEEIAKGPVAATTNEKTETSEESKETDPMEGFTEIQASAPTPFANQSNQGVQTTQTAETAKSTKTETVVNESMMMRTSETSMASDLTNLLSSRFPSKNGQLTIELDPENLGKITINVSYDSGHAAVSISATNQKTVEILTQNASAMANIIQQKTGQETQVYIPNAQESNTKQDMASGRESNENAEQQQARQQAQQSERSEQSSSAFLQQMRLGLV